MPLDAHHYSALHQAAHDGDAREVAELIASGADVNEVDAIGWIPLFWCCANTFLETKESHALCAKLLIEAKAAVNFAVEGPNAQRSPLHYACFSDNRACTRLLLDAGAATDSTDEDGSTPLHFACHVGRVECTRLLLAAGATQNLGDKDGETPLHYAATNAHTECVPEEPTHSALPTPCAFPR